MKKCNFRNCTTLIEHDSYNRGFCSVRCYASEIAKLEIDMSALDSRIYSLKDRMPIYNDDNFSGKGHMEGKPIPSAQDDYGKVD